MPLLKCLFEEINKLQNLMQNKVPTNPSQLINIANNRLPNPKSQHQSIQKPRQPQQMGILKKRIDRKLTKEKIYESVNRLAQPKPKFIPVAKKSDKTMTDESNLSETSDSKRPIPKPRQNKQPLKYGLTNTYKMRLLATRPNQVDKINVSHETLLKEVKKNLDDLNLSVATTTNEQLTEIIQNNLEKLLQFDSTGSTANMSQQSIRGTGGSSGGGLNKTPTGGNLTLLNKVEMESTIDTMNYQNLLNNNFNNSTSQSPTKMVQFANTHVYNTISPVPHSDESTSGGGSGSGSRATNTNRTYDDDESTESKSSSKRLGKNIFLERGGKGENLSQYDEDFHSSLDSSSSNLMPAGRKSPRSPRRTDFFNFDPTQSTNSKYTNDNSNQSYNSHSFVQESVSSSK